MQAKRVTKDLTLEAYRLDEDGRAVLALVQTQAGRDPVRVWIPLNEVKAVVAALTEGAIGLVEDEWEEFSPDQDDSREEGS